MDQVHEDKNLGAVDLDRGTEQGLRLTDEELQQAIRRADASSYFAPLGRYFRWSWEAHNESAKRSISDRGTHGQASETKQD